jgi:hypothetical protein
MSQIAPSKPGEQPQVLNHRVVANAHRFGGETSQTANLLQSAEAPVWMDKDLKNILISIIAPHRAGVNTQFEGLSKAGLFRVSVL